MNIQKKIKEAMKRRHQNEAGFTLIELLVVILIIAILAAVAIAAFLSSLDSAKKSNATKLLRSTMSDITSIQAGQGYSDYTAITLADLQKAEKDVAFFNTLAGARAEKNEVGFVNNAGAIVLSAKDKSFCYTVRLEAGAITTYGKGPVAACVTPATATVLADNSNTDQKFTWK